MTSRPGRSGSCDLSRTWPGHSLGHVTSPDPDLDALGHVTPPEPNQTEPPPVGWHADGSCLLVMRRFGSGSGAVLERPSRAAQQSDVKRMQTCRPHGDLGFMFFCFAASVQPDNGNQIAFLIVLTRGLAGEDVWSRLDPPPPPRTELTSDDLYSLPWLSWQPPAACLCCTGGLQVRWATGGLQVRWSTGGLQVRWATGGLVCVSPVSPPAPRTPEASPCFSSCRLVFVKRQNQRHFFNQLCTTCK